MRKAFFPILIFTFLTSVGPAVAQTTPAQLNDLLGRKEAVAVNTMSRLECDDHRIKGSLCIPCESLERELPGRVKDRSAQVVLYCDLPPCECTAELARKMGYSKSSDLSGGLAGWKGAGYEAESVRRVPRGIIPSLQAEELSRLLEKKTAVLVVDIRPEKAYREGHVSEAINIPLDSLENRYPEIPIDRTVVIVDQGGSRSYLAASYLASKGMDRVRWLDGGMAKWMALQARTKQQR